MATYSVTERATFKRCERQWRLTAKSGAHLGAIVSPVYLSVGTLIHKASQTWLLNNPPGLGYQAHVTLAADTMLGKAHMRYLAQVGVEMHPEEDDLLYQAIHFARTMAENYEIRWGTPLPEGFTLIRPEQRAQIPVKGTEHECELASQHDHRTGSLGWVRRPRSDRSDETAVWCVCEGCGGTGRSLHYLDMRFDGLIQDAAGRIHVLEHKTYNARPKVVSLNNNDQFLAYIWGARQLNIGHVVGLAYDGLWRRDKVPRGRQFEDLFMRHTIMRSKPELDEFERLLPYELNEMWAKRPSERPLDTLPINRQWQGCFDCRFEDSPEGAPGLCAAMSRDQPGLIATLLKTKFTERDDDADEFDADAAEGATAVA